MVPHIKIRICIQKNQLQKGFRNLDYLLNYHLAKYGMLDEMIKNYFL